MLSVMKRSTVEATFFSSSAYACICCTDESTMAWNVPWMSEPTNEGKSMALSVARVTSPTRPVAVAPPPAGAGAAPGDAPGDGTAAGCCGAGDAGAGEDGDDGVR